MPKRFDQSQIQSTQFHHTQIQHINQQQQPMQQQQIHLHHQQQQLNIQQHHQQQQQMRSAMAQQAQAQAQADAQQQKLNGSPYAVQNVPQPVPFPSQVNTIENYRAISCRV